jgi:hypothetical protein
LHGARWIGLEEAFKHRCISPQRHRDHRGAEDTERNVCRTRLTARAH